MSTQNLSFDQSSSSQPQPHSQQGQRLRRFNEVLEKTKTNPNDLSVAHVQVLEFMRKHVKEEFSLILEKRNIPEKMNEFDALIDKARQRQNEIGYQSSLIYPMSPKTILRAKILPLKDEELKHLKEEFSKINEENTRLMSELKVKKEHSNRMALSIREIKSELNKAVEVTTEIPVDEMQTIIETVIKLPNQ
ncbi:8835_t:CDS:2 [Diversispora eburnea]|uniref:8835_t:CDS:1 n=1 Tax=Diversispora eburnea TaxID=1213867 RepID=A0A9N9BTP1_9GLOM|nr:8835_t:CDS:2 [Diversispora eburnea]